MLLLSALAGAVLLPRTQRRHKETVHNDIKSKAENDGLQFAWYPDTDASTDTETNKGFAARQNYIIDQPATRGTFKLRAPLFLFYGFTENFLALKGYNLEFEMVRGPDYPALFRADNGVPEGKFKFKEISFRIY